MQAAKKRQSKILIRRVAVTAIFIALVVTYKISGWEPLFWIMFAYVTFTFLAMDRYLGFEE